MRTQAHRRRRSTRGQGIVEFAIVAPIAIAVILAILSGSWLFFQNEAVTDGARGGARAAAIATSLYQQTGGTGPFCESGSPTTIAYAVSHAAPQLPVNPAVLCAPSGSTTQLTQTAVTGDAAISVTATPSLAAPTAVTVTVTYNAQGLAPPLRRNFTFTASSAQPILQPN